MASLRRVDPTIEVDRSCAAGEVPGSAVETIGAAAAEALRNSVVHAATSPRTVSVSVSPDHIEVVVLDQGPGFVLDQFDARQLGVRHSILGRMHGLPGGEASVESVPGEGTKVRLSWRI